jgi:hypothetical protein
MKQVLRFMYSGLLMATGVLLIIGNPAVVAPSLWEFLTANKVLLLAVVLVDIGGYVSKR